MRALNVLSLGIWRIDNGGKIFLVENTSSTIKRCMRDDNMLGLSKSINEQSVSEKMLVTGVTGQLGHDVCKELKKRNIEYIGTSSIDFDITDKEKNQRLYIILWTNSCDSL